MKAIALREKPDSAIPWRASRSRDIDDVRCNSHVPKCFSVGAVLLVLAACVPQAPVPAPQVVGETSAGQPIYQFRVTSSNALGLTPVSERSIAARANGICPGGYVEFARRTLASRRVSGVFYLDVDVRIACR